MVEVASLKSIYGKPNYFQNQLKNISDKRLKILKHGKSVLIVGPSIL
jgi:hypothetical protein